MQEKPHISKGAFQIARKLFASDIWLSKPSSWLKIWIYILGKVSHKSQGKYERGEGFFNWKNELEYLGKDVTKDMVKKAISFMKSDKMISTRKSTTGMYIKVLNYNVYQELDHYSSTNKSTTVYKNETHKNNTNTSTVVQEDPERAQQNLIRILEMKKKFLIKKP